MRIRNNTLAISGVIIAFCLFFQTTSAHESQWYAGAGFGRTLYDINVVDFNDGSITSAWIDNNDAGWKLFGGWRLLKSFSLEAGYVDLNTDPDDETTFNGFSNGAGTEYAAGGVSVDVNDPVVYYVAGVGVLPLYEKTSLFGKLGLTGWEADITTRDSSGRRDKKEDGSDWMYSIGLEHRFNNRFAVRVEWEQFNDVFKGEYILRTIGASYAF